jgi:hypothetical protein
MAVGGEVIERVSHFVSPDVGEIPTTVFLTRALAPDRGVVNHFSVQ